ncbi:MAG: acyl-CoA dehydrogenase [Acidobacteria bacterium]|nr:MAG: acyl-CoA dehydrogenase [Acidobacteriota bacterium]PYY24500.1 MAG: acyl-CoA dehydrogenase [Acidobacteriota bacterium]
MPDHSFLSWPFFEESHRKLAHDVATLLEQNPDLNKDDVRALPDERCRILVRAFGDNLRKHAVPAPFGHAQELDIRSVCLIRESLAYHSGLADFAFAMQGLGSCPISLFGSDALRRKYLPNVVSGEMIAAFAISEPEAGSDVRAMKTSACREGDHFVINGTKTWISNAGLADFYVIFCRYPEGGEKSFVALLVPGKIEGLKVSRFDVIAPHPIGTLEFKDCRVPAAAIVGKEGEGLKVALATLDLFRPTVGAAALGFARRAFDEAVRWSKNRRAFGKSLSEFQITQTKLAEMALAIDTSALLVYRAAWTHDVLKQSVTREASMAKLHATESAQRVIDEAVQILGGHGVVAGSVTEKLYREIRALRIYEGTSEIQKLIIANHLLKTAAGEGSAG